MLHQGLLCCEGFFIAVQLAPGGWVSERAALQRERRVLPKSVWGVAPGAWLSLGMTYEAWQHSRLFDMRQPPLRENLRSSDAVLSTRCRLLFLACGAPAGNSPLVVVGRAVALLHPHIPRSCRHAPSQRSFREAVA